MKKFCVVRHASYNFETGHLNSCGEKEAMMLANSLQTRLGLVEATIVSSDAIRARETADMIALKFGGTIAMHRCLSVDETDRERLMFKMYNLVKHYEQQRKEDLIFVTHEMQATFFPVYFARERFDLDWDEPRVDKGTGWMIDCVEQTLRYLP